MKMKRLLGGFLALAMTLPLALTGCQKEADDLESNTSIRRNVVLNMYILTDKETNPEQAEAVELALNEILLPDYRTVVKLNYITSDGADEAEYWNAIDKTEEEALAYIEQLEAEAEAKKQAEKEANKNKNKNEKKEEEEELSAEELEELEEDEYDRLVNMIYGKADTDPDPEVDNSVKPGIVLENPQLDIFVVNNPEKYRELIDAKRLAPLDTYFATTAKVLKSYMYPTFLDGAKLGGISTYGIPTNKAIGQYEYLVFNKALLDKYGYSAENMTTLDDLAPYLATIRANEPGVVPLALSEGGVAPQFFDYLGEDGNAIGTYYDAAGHTVFLKSAYDPKVTVVSDHFKKVREYRLAGYIPATYTEGTPFAVDIRKGYAYSPAQWSEDEDTEYACSIYKMPIAENENTLDSVFVVSAASRNPDRAAEIITLFSTVPELANMLQYGVEEVNYYAINEDGETKVKLPDSKAGAGYYMNNDYTGNHYIKMNIAGTDNHLDDYKQQNNDSVYSLAYAYQPTLWLRKEVLVAQANEISQQYFAGLCRGEYDVDTVFAEINAKLATITNVDEADILAWLEDNPGRMSKYTAEIKAATLLADEAAEAVEIANKSLDTVNENAKNFSTAKKDADKANEAYTDAENAVTKAKDAYNKADSGKDELKKAYDEAKKASAEAKKAAQTATKIYEDLISSTQRAVDEAKSAAKKAASNAEDIVIYATDKLPAEAASNAEKAAEIAEDVEKAAAKVLGKETAEETVEETEEEELTAGEIARQEEGTAAGNAFDEIVKYLDDDYYNNFFSSRESTENYVASTEYFDINNKHVIEKNETVDQNKMVSGDTENVTVDIPLVSIDGTIIN